VESFKKFSLSRQTDTLDGAHNWEEFAGIRTQAVQSNARPAMLRRSSDRNDNNKSVWELQLQRGSYWFLLAVHDSRR
jgi:hypothetical protein